MIPLGLAALCLAFLLPGHYLPWLAFQQQAMSASGCLLLAAAIYVDPHSRLLRWPRPALFACIVAIIPLLQLAFGQIEFLSDGVLSCLYVVGFALSVVVGATLARSQK